MGKAFAGGFLSGVGRAVSGHGERQYEEQQTAAKESRLDARYGNRSKVEELRSQNLARFKQGLNREDAEYERNLDKDRYSMETVNGNREQVDSLTGERRSIGGSKSGGGGYLNTVFGPVKSSEAMKEYGRYSKTATEAEELGGPPVMSEAEWLNRIQSKSAPGEAPPEAPPLKGKAPKTPQEGLAYLQSKGLSEREIDTAMEQRFPGWKPSKASVKTGDKPDKHDKSSEADTPSREKGESVADYNKRSKEYRADTKQDRELFESIESRFLSRGKKPLSKNEVKGMINELERLQHAATNFFIPNSFARKKAKRYLEALKKMQGDK